MRTAQQEDLKGLSRGNEICAKRFFNSVFFHCCASGAALFLLHLWLLTKLFNFCNTGSINEISGGRNSRGAVTLIQDNSVNDWQYRAQIQNRCLGDNSEFNMYMVPVLYKIQLHLKASPLTMYTV